MNKITGKVKVSLDSRMVKDGEYFVPVKGDNFDGHDFIDAALKRGARGVIEECDLYKIAQQKIKKIKPVIIGVTGSSGKTTVTSYLHQILKEKYKVCQGRLNTKLGLTVDVINEMTEDCEIFVAEIGMDRLGEIEDTTRIYRPDIAVITTINHVHVEKLGSMSNLVKAKGEMLKSLDANKGVAVLNSENRHIKYLSKSFNGKIIWFDSNPLLPYSSKLLGPHVIRNLNVCVIVGRLLKISDTEILDVIEKIVPPKGRLNLIKGINGSNIIDDTYNANPESVKLSLGVLSNFKGIRKVAVLGDMLELGNLSAKDHKDIADYIGQLGIDIFVGVGKKQKNVYKNVQLPEASKFWISSSEEFSSLLEKGILKIKKGDCILVKGSQGIRMEKIVKRLMRDPDEAENLLVRQDARWDG